MASSPETITPNQLKRARIALWHQDGNALRTADAARVWLNDAGLVPYYPHTQFTAPQPSFAEAVLGRPENGWVPAPAKSVAFNADEDSYAVVVGDEESVEDSDDESDDESDFDEDAEDEEAEDGDEDASASDDEIMLSNDDEAAEDEGDEIAEVDRIDTQGNPVPNDVVAAEAEPEPINGFSAEERETVNRMLARMVAEGSAVPLNLLGSTTGEPDYICSSQAFSFVYTLRGDKGWKTEPAQTGSMRVSPLAAKVYEALKEKGASTLSDLSNEVREGVVDSAVLRALSELWAIQRVIPVPSADGEPTKWELMTGRFVRHLKAGANAGQPTALSALLSLYLSQTVAASSDEMEIYLSPLAARSRVREVVSGLAATRQLDSLVVEGKTLMHIAGALNDLPSDETPASAGVQQRSRYEADDRRHMDEARAARGEAPFERKSKYPVRKPMGARAEGERSGRPGGPRPGGPRPSSPRPGGFQRPRPGGFGAPRTDDRERRPFTRRDEGAAAPGKPRNEFARPWDEDRRPAAEGESAETPQAYTPRESSGGERRPFTGSGGYRPAFSGARKPFGDRPSSGERRPFTPREGGGERRPFTPREGGGERRPFTPREGGGERRPFTPREGGGRPFTPRGDGERRPFTPREGGGERRPFTPREGGGERRPFTPREGGGRPFTPRGDGERRPFTPREGGGERRPFTPREGGGERRPFTPREGGGRPFTPRGDGERRPFTPREGGGERRPFTPREGGGERRPFTPREGGRPFTPREGGGRPFTPRGDGERRPFTPREGGGERRPFTPREGGGRPFTPREGGGERRPFTPREGGDRKPFGAGRPAGDRKPYGAGGFSPARRGPGSGPGRGGAPKRRP